MFVNLCNDVERSAEIARDSSEADSCSVRTRKVRLNVRAHLLAAWQSVLYQAAALVVSGAAEVR